MVERLVLGDFGTCSYVVGEEGERQALVIDPASDSKPILETLAARNWEAHYILNTTGTPTTSGGTLL